MVSSGAIMPARAPPSIDILQTVMRSSIESARMAEPEYSNTQPVPPPMPICAISARMMSFALTPVRSVPSTCTLKVFEGRCSRHWRGQHMLHFAGADAERQRAESAVRGGVAIAADHGHAGLREALLGPDDVHDALHAGCESRSSGCRNRGNSASSCSTCVAAILSRIGQRARRGGHAVVGGGDGQIRTAHFQPALRADPSKACGEVTSCTRCRSM